jgi:RNA polymerase sigma-70 factor (ECF subfamily)
MCDDDTVGGLVAKATQGDRVALQQLMALHASELSDFVARKLPPSRRALVDADDILQQTFVDVFRDIRRFEPRSDRSFLAWLKTIADHRIQDAVKALNRIKRGGEFRQIRFVSSPSTSCSMAELVELLSAGSHTPSRSVAGHEAVKAVQDALRQLPDDYRQAVELRLLEGRSLEETAAVLDRSPRAVQGLVDRAKKKLRAALVRLSLYR